MGRKSALRLRDSGVFALNPGIDPTAVTQVLRILYSVSKSRYNRDYSFNAAFLKPPSNSKSVKIRRFEWAKMKNCPNCNYPNREGVFLCEKCGMPMESSDTATISTRMMVQAEFLPLTEKGNLTVGWTPQTKVGLYLQDVKTLVVLDQTKLACVLGRSAEAPMNADTGIDLSPYEAVQKGVSRVHAVLRRSSTALSIMDMKSTNGTYLRGQRLMPDRSYALQNGDEVVLGKLVIAVRFLDTSKK